MQNGIPVGLRSNPSFGIARQNQLTAIIQSLFWDGSQGWWYDNQDPTTLFQDSAGTTPVTAVEQSVGLQLDKSKGLVLGPDIIVNGDYSAGTANWTAFGTNLPTLSAANNQLTVSLAGPSGSAGAYQAITTVIGKWYIVRAPQINVTGVSPRLRVGTTIDGSENANVIVSNNSNSGAIFLATSTTTYISLRATLNTAGVNVIWGPVSTRELPGNHRYQTTSGSRPVWSKRVNRLTKTEQFDDAVWIRSGINAFGSGSVANTTATLDPLGGNTADFIQEDSSTGAHYVRCTGTAFGATAVFQIYVKAAGRNFAYVYSAANTFAGLDCRINLTTGAITNFAVGTTVTTVDAGNGWWRVRMEMVGTYVGGASFFALVGPANTTGSGTPSYTGDGTSGIYIWGADIRPANQATGLLPLYQRVNTATDYDTNGFPGYLKADGIDDFLQTNSIDFTATDKVTLCAGVRKLSDSPEAIFTELSANWNSNNGSFLSLPNASGTGAASTFAAAARGDAAASLSQYAVSAATPAPVTTVFTQIHNISGDLSSIRLNGSASGTNGTGDKGSGNFGNYPAYFFQRNSPAALRFNGNEYGNVAVGKLLTADQLTALETYVNGATRAY